MNRYVSLTLIALLPGGLIALAVLAILRLRRRWLRKERLEIDAQIAASGYRYVFTGQDDALRKQTEARRRHADAIKRDGRQIETRDDRASKIHLVG